MPPPGRQTSTMVSQPPRSAVLSPASAVPRRELAAARRRLGTGPGRAHDQARPGRGSFMQHLTAATLAWPAVILALAILFWVPVFIAVIRGAERIGVVVLLSFLGLAGGVMWIAALVAAFILPRRTPPLRTCPGGQAAWRP